jgi:hypothetical protein
VTAAEIKALTGTQHVFMQTMFGVNADDGKRPRTAAGRTLIFTISAAVTTASGQKAAWLSILTAMSSAPRVRAVPILLMSPSNGKWQVTTIDDIADHYGYWGLQE